MIVFFCLDGIIIDRCEKDKETSIETWDYNLPTDSINDKMHDYDGKTMYGRLRTNTSEHSDKFGYQNGNRSDVEGIPTFLCFKWLQNEFRFRHENYYNNDESISVKYINATL